MFCLRTAPIGRLNIGGELTCSVEMEWIRQMAERFSKTLVAVVGLIVLASCGGQTAETTTGTQDLPEQLDLSSESDDDAQGDSDSEASGSTSEASTEEAEAPQTTTVAPAPEFTAEQAMEAFEDFNEATNEWGQSALVDGDLTFEQTEEFLSFLDQSLIGGDPAEEALAFHSCTSESLIDISAFFEIESVELDFDHTSQTQINETTWALDVRTFTRISGIPETVDDSTYIVTTGGIGPEIDPDEDECPIPNSAEAEALIAEAREVLGRTSNGSGDASGELRPADEVVAERAVEASLPGAIGEPIQLTTGLTVTVQSLAVGGDDGGPWIAADIRTENTAEETTNPNVEIFCAGSSENGSWQADSTFNLFDSLPTGTFNEGTIHLLLPGDGRFGEEIPVCNTPAIVRVSDFSSGTSADFPIPDALINELLG